MSGLILPVPDSLAAGLALLMALMPVEAQGQPGTAQCRLPNRIPTPRVENPINERDVRRMAIGGYTPALSWTPQYCASTAARSMQCDKSIGRFGFILHGLWPDGKGRSWPQWCSLASVLPREVLAENLCVTPSVQLMQREWAKHGTCMAKKPDAYFDKARALYLGLRFPDMALMARQSRLTAGQLAGAFARANPGMRIDMIRVGSNRYGMLSDLWICLDTAFNPTRCPAGRRGLSLNSRIRVRTGY